MTITSRISEPVRAPIRTFVHRYSTFFEDLIHAVKSELVLKLDNLTNRVDEVDRSVATSHAAITDQMALQAATLRSLSAEVERLRTVVGQLQISARPVADPLGVYEPDTRSRPSQTRRTQDRLPVAQTASQ